MALENAYKRGLKKRIRDLLPGCEILDLDPERRQGILDMLVLYGPHWAMLEVKKSADASIRPNQAYYVEYFDEMSFAAFIYPENEDEVLNALQSTFLSGRRPRLSRR